MQATPQRQHLFVASCLALLVTSLSFGIRAGILVRPGVAFDLNATLIIPVILSVAFAGLFFFMRNKNKANSATVNIG